MIGNWLPMLTEYPSIHFRGTIWLASVLSNSTEVSLSTAGHVPNDYDNDRDQMIQIPLESLFVNHLFSQIGSPIDMICPRPLTLGYTQRKYSDCFSRLYVKVLTGMPSSSEHCAVLWPLRGRWPFSFGNVHYFQMGRGSYVYSIVPHRQGKKLILPCWNCFA